MRSRVKRGWSVTGPGPMVNFNLSSMLRCKYREPSFRFPRTF